MNVNVNKLIRALVLVAVFGIGMYIFAKGGSSLFRSDNVQTISYSDFVADISGTGDNQISHGNFVKDNFRRDL